MNKYMTAFSAKVLNAQPEDFKNAVKPAERIESRWVDYKLANGTYLHGTGDGSFYDDENNKWYELLLAVLDDEGELTETAYSFGFVCNPHGKEAHVYAVHNSVDLNEAVPPEVFDKLVKEVTYTEAESINECSRGQLPHVKLETGLWLDGNGDGLYEDRSERHDVWHEITLDEMNEDGEIENEIYSFGFVRV